ncbi:glutamate-rich protein 6 [Gastrophryne carolinensis]
MLRQCNFDEPVRGEEMPLHVPSTEEGFSADEEDWWVAPAQVFGALGSHLSAATDGSSSAAGHPLILADTDCPLVVATATILWSLLLSPLPPVFTAFSTIDDTPVLASSSVAAEASAAAANHAMVLTNQTATNRSPLLANLTFATDHSLPQCKVFSCASRAEAPGRKIWKRGMDPSMVVSVSLQTEASWLQERNLENVADQYLQSDSLPVNDLPDDFCKEEDLYSSLSDDLSELSILCDMEFSCDFNTYFEKHLQTLPSIGPPTIMAYKRESDENDRITAIMKVLKEKSGKDLCKFCRKPLKPFPVVYTLDPAFSEEVFCCKQFKNVFQYLFKEQKQKLQDHDIELISVAPHGPYGSEVERQKAKEKTAQRLRERHLAKVFQAVVTEPTTFTEFGRPMKTISYQLSTAPPVGDNWTVVAEEADSMSTADTLENDLCLCDFASEMVMSERFTEIYYRTGRKFLTVFPDGTAQIFYPSGNLAIIIIPSKVKESLCIVQEDKEQDAEMLALFGSTGTATCYYPNGTVWLIINPLGGQISDRAGRRVRRWHWKMSDLSTPCAQFKPIFLSLNHQVGVRILAQDKIYVSFLAMGKQAKFSVGRRVLTKSQMEITEASRQRLNSSLALPEDELIIFAIKIKFLILLNKCYECLHFPSEKQWERIRPPSFLLAQAQRLIYLCSVYDISTDISTSIRNMLGSYVTDVQAN